MAESYRSVLKYARISPRKVRLVVNLIRGRSLTEALVLLRYSPRRGAMFVDKALRSAWASAQAADAAAEESDFVVSRAMVDKGPTIHRGRAASMGRSARIHKRTSHIVVEISPQGGEPNEEADTGTDSGQE